MTESPPASVLLIGERGRVVIPAAVRRAAGISEGTELVAHASGAGRIVLETRDAIRARVWDAAPAPGGTNATADVRSMRDEDNLIADAHFGRASEVGDDTAGAALLSLLGLA